MPAHRAPHHHAEHLLDRALGRDTGQQEAHAGLANRGVPAALVQDTVLEQQRHRDGPRVDFDGEPLDGGRLLEQARVSVAEQLHLLKALISDIPLQRLGEPEDIAASVVFLASEQGGYITGQTLHVNGGMFMI